MRIRSLLLVPALCAAYTVGNPLVAAPVPSSSIEQSPPRDGPSGPAESQQEQRSADAVVNAEKLFIRFQGYPELTGEYRVNADETVSIALVGRINVSSLSAAQLEEVLRRRATELAKHEVFVTLEAATYKPLFVTGFVSRPGAVQWTPRMTVLQATALAGGTSRGLLTGATEMPVDAGSLVRLAKALDDQKRLLANLGRLRAERDNAETLTTPPALVQLVGKTEAESLVDAQRSVLSVRRSALEGQLAALQRGRTLAAQELDGLRSQSTRVAEQLALRRDTSKNIDELRAKGIVNAQRAVEEKIRVSELEEKSANVAVALARVQATLAGMQREERSLTQERRASLDTEILKTERDIAQLSIDIEAARGSRNDALALVRPPSSTEPTALRYTIIRMNAGVQDRIVVGEDAFLRPGDVLFVAQG